MDIEAQTRVEHFLGAIAGVNEIPNYPEESLTRVERFLKYIAEHGGGGVTPEDLAKKLDKTIIETRVPTLEDEGQVGQFWLNTEDYMLYTLESVDDSDPENPAYIWVAVGGAGSSHVEITTTGDSGTFTAEQIEMLTDPSLEAVIMNGGKAFGLANKQADLTYRTYINLDAATGEALAAKAIYIQLDESAVNYGHWSLEEVDFPGGGGGEVVHVLTEADYNYPVSNPTQIAVWLLPDGIYGFAPGSIKDNTNFGNSTLPSFSANVSQIVDGFILVKNPQYNYGGRTFFGFQRGGSASGTLMASSVVMYGIQDSDGSVKYEKTAQLLSQMDIINNLTTSSGGSVLDARQGKVLKNLIDSLVISGAGAPTTSTVGTVGKLYEDTTNGDLYQCTAVSGSTYTWEAVGGGGGGVQFTSGSTLPTSANPGDLFQLTSGRNAIFIRKSDNKWYQILVNQDGGASNSFRWTDHASGNTIMQIYNQDGTFPGALSFGFEALSQHKGGIALGAKSATSSVGEMNIGSSNTSYGYNNSNYRLLTGVYDGQSAHDAATYGQLQALEARIAALEAQLNA